MEKLLEMVMTKYDRFYDAAPSDVALGIILCSRILSDIQTNI